MEWDITGYIPKHTSLVPDSECNEYIELTQEQLNKCQENNNWKFYEESILKQLEKLELTLYNPFKK